MFQLLLLFLVGTRVELMEALIDDEGGPIVLVFCL
jgi:hypothetical protein